MSGRRGLPGWICFAASAVLIGCGGGGDAGDLVERLPADAIGYQYSDLAAVREDLDLPEDADPFDLDAEGEDAGTFAQSAIGLGPMGGAIDPDTFAALELGQADAAASSSTPDATVISTAADLEQVEATLTDLGWEDEGGTLVNDEQALALGDGLISYAETAAEAEGVIGEPSGETLQPFDDIEDPLITVFVPDTDDGCLRYIATGDTPRSGGEVVFYPVDEPDPANVDVPPDEGLGEPVVDGEAVRVEVEPDPESPTATAARDALSLFLVNYECDQG